MHPFLFSEIQQTKRHIWIGLIAYFVMLTFLRYTFGDIGFIILLGLIVVFINISLGAAAFFEEIAKSRLQFFNIIPVRRSNLWLVKIAFGLTNGFAIILISALFLIFIPGEDRSSFLEFSSLNIMNVILLLFVMGLLTYAIGLFSVCFCLLPYLSVLFLVPGIALIPVAFLLTYLFFGSLPSVSELTILVFVTSIPLYVGSYYIDSIRNPFLEQKWKWRKVAAIFTLITLAVFALTFESLGIRKKNATAHYYQGIWDFSISPDEKHVYVKAFKSPILSDHYLLDAKGKLVMDLGRVYYNRVIQEIWPPENAGQFLIYDKSDYYPPEQMNLTPLRLVNISNQKVSKITNLNLLDKEHLYTYHGITRDGKFLYGRKYKEIKHRSILYAIFRQNISTGNVESIDIYPRHEDTDRYVRYLPHDRVLIDFEYIGNGYGSGYSQFNKKDELFEDPNETITLINLNNFATNIYTIPKHTENWQITPDGKTLITLQRIPFESYVGYHLVALDLFTQKQTTLLKPPILPQLDFQDFLKDRSAWISFDISPYGRWVSYERYPSEPNKVHWLLDWQEKKRYKLLEYEDTHYDDAHRFHLSKTLYTKDEFRICMFYYHTQNANTPTQKNWIQLEIYDWTGNGFDKTYSHELPDNYRNFKLLDHKRILFNKPGELKFLSHTDELWVLHLDTGQQHRFFQDKPLP